MSTPQIASLTTLVRDPAQLASTLQTARARDGAREFEATLFGQVLDKMEKSLSITEESSDDAGHDTWSAIATHAVAQALADRHVLGISQMIEHSLGLKASINSPDSETEDNATSAKNISANSLKSLKLPATLPIHISEGVSNR